MTGVLQNENIDDIRVWREVDRPLLVATCHLIVSRQTSEVQINKIQEGVSLECLR
jgi:hypothetical protein